MNSVQPFHYLGATVYHYRLDCRDADSKKERILGTGDLKRCVHCLIMEKEEQISRDSGR